MCGGGRGFDCSGSGVDRVVVRAIPDKADGSAEMDYPTFEDQAAAHCANMVLEFVKTFH